MPISSSSFPTGAPGAGLLLLRSAVAAALLSEWPDSSIAILIIAAAIAFSLSIGFLTMITALLATLMQTIGAFTHEIVATPWILGSIAQSLSLALLGPGAFSLDARLFGRRLIFESRRRHSCD